MSQDYIEKIVWFLIKRFAGKCRDYVKRKTNKSSNKEFKDLATNSNLESNLANNAIEHHGENVENVSKTNLQSDTEEPLSEKSDIKTSQQSINIKKEMSEQRIQDIQGVEKYIENSQLDKENRNIFESEPQVFTQIKCDIVNNLNADSNREEHLTDNTAESFDGNVKKYIRNNLKNNSEECLSENSCIITSQDSISRKEHNTEINDTSDQKNKSEVKKRKTGHLSEQYHVKQVKKIEVKTVKEDNELAAVNNSIFFHSTLFFIWCIITIINLPATLTWAHNFRFNKVLTPDSSFIPGFILSFCALPLWQLDFPKVHRKWSGELEIFITIIAVLSLTFATISTYRLNYLLTLIIVIITLHQLFAPESTTEASDSNVDDSNEFNYENVKLKLN